MTAGATLSHPVTHRRGTDATEPGHQPIGTSLKSERACWYCPLKHNRGVKKAERKAWKVATVRLDQSDKRLRKLQASANKCHEAIETSFRQLGGKTKRARKGDISNDQKGQKK